MSRLERLLRPRSIAVIGGLQASRVIEQCRLMGYAGDIWPVHPTKTKVQGLAAFASVADLPDSPDAAFIGVNRHLTIDIVKALRAKKCGGAICYASGFLEADEVGAKLQAQLIEAADEMPIFGPNCYGLINYVDGALLWPDQQGGKRLEQGQNGVAIIAQSSNIAINFSMQQRGLPLAYILTVGNQALVGSAEMALAILDDPRVTALGMYIEGFDSIQSMQQLGQKSRALKKPVVIYKVGKTERSQQSTLTHTASLAGSYSSASAFLKRNGFGQVESLTAFLETLKLLHVHGALSGYCISSMSCSGGEANIIADAVDGRKLHFGELSSVQKTQMTAALGPLVSIANPLDYQTYCWGDAAVMEAAYSAMVAGDFDMNYLILDFPHRARCDDREWQIAVDAYDAALKKNQAKGAIVVGMPENISEDYTELFTKRGMVSLYGIDDALTATEIAADIATAWRRQSPSILKLGDLKLTQASKDSSSLDEAKAKQELSEYGVQIPQGKQITSLDQAAVCAQQIGFPLALKALGISHKTEQNALRLHLNSVAAVEQSAAELFNVSDRLYLEAMVQNPIAELIVGITRDAQFGLVLTLGSGGILVEILKDVTTLIIPFERVDVQQALLSLKSAPLLAGYRGKPKVDLDAAIDAIMAIQNYAIAQADKLIELDVNPLLLCAKGAYAADALIVLNTLEGD